MRILWGFMGGFMGVSRDFNVFTGGTPLINGVSGKGMWIGYE